MDTAGIAAAPHARGSTHDRDGRESARAGCPACAGIDPRTSRTRSRSAGLPRMRGDRPADRARVSAEVKAAPHARGSTRDTPAAHDAALGCPACAGIDPSHLTARAVTVRAAPHARGSTRRRGHRHDGADGCPACAGIDPNGDRWSPTLYRLPRMRGDRPCVGEWGLATHKAAPHARGSTPAQGALHRDPRGCPACAGIDPAIRRSATRWAWLPRMRGDRPALCGHGARRIAAAPHARGSTRSPWTRRSRHDGCPACAGIDPIRATCCRRGRRLPRMRGDRPSIRGYTALGTPAAPHARGSTLGRAPIPAVRPGCPACAGIDPT